MDITSQVQINLHQYSMCIYISGSYYFIILYVCITYYIYIAAVVHHCKAFSRLFHLPLNPSFCLHYKQIIPNLLQGHTGGYDEDRLFYENPHLKTPLGLEVSLFTEM